MSFDIRISTAKDEAQISVVLERSYSILLARDYKAEVLRAALPMITRANPALLASGRYFAARLSEDGPIIGIGGWSKEAPGRGGITQGLGHIRHVAVDPSATRLGVGAAIIARVIEQARAERIESLSCFSTLSAVTFYHAQGFETVGQSVLHMGGKIPFEITQMHRSLTR